MQVGPKIWVLARLNLRHPDVQLAEFWIPERPAEPEVVEDYLLITYTKKFLCKPHVRSEGVKLR